MRSFGNHIFAVIGLLILSLGIQNGILFEDDKKGTLFLLLIGASIFVSSILDEINK